MAKEDSDTLDEKGYRTPQEHRQADYEDPIIPEHVREQLRREDALVGNIGNNHALDDESILEDDHVRGPDDAYEIRVAGIRRASDNPDDFEDSSRLSYDFKPHQLK